MRAIRIGASNTLVLVILVALCLGCTRGGAIWLQHGSDATHLVFGIAEDHADGHPLPPLDGFSVAQYPCRGSQPEAIAIWSFGPISRKQAATIVTRVTYGTLPPGYEVHHIAVPMRAGCYVASFDADGYYAHLEFVITSDGAALALR